MPDKPSRDQDPFGLINYLDKNYDRYGKYIEAAHALTPMLSTIASLAAPFLIAGYLAKQLHKGVKGSKIIKYDKELENIYSNVGISKTTPTFTLRPDIINAFFYGPSSARDVEKVFHYLDLTGETNLKNKKDVDLLRRGMMRMDLIDKIIREGMIASHPLVKTHGILAHEAGHGLIDKSDEAPAVKFLQRYLYGGPLHLLLNIALIAYSASNLKKIYKEHGKIDFAKAMPFIFLPTLAYVGTLIPEYMASYYAKKRHIDKANISEEEKRRQKGLLNFAFGTYLNRAMVYPIITTISIAGLNLQTMLAEIIRRNIARRMARKMIDEFKSYLSAGSK